MELEEVKANELSAGVLRYTYRFGRLATFLPLADLWAVEQIGECEPLLASNFTLIQFTGFVTDQI